MVSAAPRLQDDVIDLEDSERELRPAAALLLAEQDVLVLAVGNGRLDVRAVRDVGAGSDVAVMKQTAHGLLEAHVDQLDGFRGNVYADPLRPSLSAATQAVAQPQKGTRTMSSSLLLALMMRSKRAKGLLRGVAGAFLSVRAYLCNVIPQILHRHSVQFIGKTLPPQSPSWFLGEMNAALSVPLLHLFLAYAGS